MTSSNTLNKWLHTFNSSEQCKLLWPLTFGFEPMYGYLRPYTIKNAKSCIKTCNQKFKKVPPSYISIYGG